MKKGQKTTYEKSYFKGYNKSDPSVLAKFPSKRVCKNVARKTK